MKFLSRLVSLSVLASCGSAVDDPENPPLLGEWEDKSELLSVMIDGGAVDEEQIPQIKKLGRLNKAPSKFCGEPAFRDKVSWQNEIDRGNIKCNIDDVTGGGSRIVASGTCVPIIQKGISSSVTFTGEGRASENESSLRGDIETTLTDEQTGEGMLLNIIFRRTMTRLGDC